jgi:hypothetical protein
MYVGVSVFLRKPYLAAESNTPLFDHFFEIGLVAFSRRNNGPAALVVCKFAFFLTNSQISKMERLKKHENRHFPMACLSPEFRPNFALKKDNLACTGTTIGHGSPRA